MPSESRVRQVGVPSAVRDEQQTQLARHLGRVTRVEATSTVSPLPLWAPSIDRWWSATAADFDVMTDRQTAGTMVLVDALRPPPPLDSIGKPEGPERLVFCDIGSVEGRRLQGAIEPIDVTGVLWAHGLTVIDVDRVPVRTAKGIWHVVAGIARRTPQPAES